MKQEFFLLFLNTDSAEVSTISSADGSGTSGDSLISSGSQSRDTRDGSMTVATLDSGSLLNGVLSKDSATFKSWTKFSIQSYLESWPFWSCWRQCCSCKLFCRWFWEPFCVSVIKILIFINLPMRNECMEKKELGQERGH
jgi:hypothetical protein